MTTTPDQSISLAIDLPIPRRPHRSTICAGATLVTLSNVTLPAAVWAHLRGLKWQTVKMRRHRGADWTEAMAPALSRGCSRMRRWNDHA